MSDRFVTVWVAPDGEEVRAGDTVEFWVSEPGYHRERKHTKKRAKVLNMLVFDDHVQVNLGWAGTTVDADNFIRKVGGTRRNPSLKAKPWVIGKNAASDEGEGDDAPLYWSRSSGWVDFDSADRFTDAERTRRSPHVGGHYVRADMLGRLESLYPIPPPRPGQIVSVGGKAKRITKVLGPAADGYRVKVGQQTLTVHDDGRRGNPTAGVEDRIARIRRIVTNKQWEKIEGTMVDGFTASHIIAVYDALNAANKEKFARMPLPKMARVAFQLTNRKNPRLGLR